jgi:hypothetical protein
VVIENLYIQTSLMVALSLFRGKERGGPIYKSEVDIIYIYIYIQISSFGGAGEYHNM